MNTPKVSTFAILICLWAIIISCDNPRTSRIFNYDSSATTSNSVGVNLNNNTSTNSNSTTTSTTVTLPSDIESSCSFSTDGINQYLKNNPHIGAYNFCKSTSYNNVFYFQVKDPTKDKNSNLVQICFIPMTTISGKSIYIGNPQCGNYVSSTNIKKITFTKFSSYANATINAVIIFKDGAYYYSAFNGDVNTLTAFQACMNNLYYNDPTYCNSFKATNQYVFHSL